MAQIIHFTSSNLLNKPEPFLFDGSIGEYLAENIEAGTPFTVFEGQPCLENDVTFDCDGNPNIEYLMTANGEFIIVETPSASVAVQFFIAIVVAVIVVALTPKPDVLSNVNRSQESPNNALSSRSNRARPLQRVPDIKGSVKAIPDIIAPTYSTYEGNTEIEHGYYCVGRKQLDIEDVKDSDTPISLISKASAGIYYPNNSPNLGAPDVAINGHVSEPIVSAYRNNQVNGITLSPDYVSGLIDGRETNWSRDTPPSTIVSIIKWGYWDASYIVGENLILTNFFVDGIDVSGTYPILSTNGFVILGLFELTIDFGSVFPVSGGIQPDSGIITPEDSSEYTDWIYNTKVLFDSALINIVAPNGMFLDTGALQLQARTVDFEIQIEGVDADGIPDGVVDVLTGSISGSVQNIIGISFTEVFSVPKYFRVRAKRTTVRYTGSGSVVDEIKLEDVYGIKNIDLTDFGDVTTIQTRTVATPFATSFKERQLNCQATEMVDKYLGSGVFDGFLTPNTRAVQSFIADAIDPVIGKRTLSEIEADDLLLLDLEINSYFGIPDHGQFNYTFDSTDISFQQYTQTIFNAINCIAFRENGKISALFERPQTTPAMLFTHRSKKPDSEVHARNTNPATINDGVEFTYVDQSTDTSEVIYIPANKSALNPKKFDIPGIQNEKQAIIRARREYNKLLHNKISLDVTVTAEGRYVKPNDMISVVKGTRVMTFDGEVLAQDGFILTLSSDVSFVAGDHYIILKNKDGSTESILVTAGVNSNQVVLNSAPTESIRTGIDTRRTEFSFGSESAHLADRWLAQEIDISDKWFVNIKAINYSDEYYIDDLTPVNAFSNGFSNGFG